MTSKSLSDDKPVGVIGAGNFGSVVANLLAQHRQVLLYARDPKAVEHINTRRENRGHTMLANVRATSDLPEIANTCDVIFPIVPSQHFRSVIRQLSPHLHPYHILIHGTKGFDLTLPEGQTIENTAKLNRSHVKTMSEVIMEESVAVRVGCLAGPNLSKELAAGHPAATVIASHFNEVISLGKRMLRNEQFQVYGNNDTVGVELAGVLKNIIAIAAGALSGLGYGENAKGLLISRGMVEMIYLGRALGGNTKAFLGVAGVGDLVTTCNSSLSRNFTIGSRLAKGETLQEILATTDEVAEGINTIRIVKKCADYYKVRAPITNTLYQVLFEDLTVHQALRYLMRYPLNVDIDFI
ncbi:NAD(P)H-dependent glycerol-3-phosphate dehydrogenase [Parachryseolinea silvisoli]|jgi:glycerol-3-phosphate dehydrogenase (NAD(P)+)|uniref:NAD(P)H-dependent glycerol-3-phosphate dehydrogenase n=1 Tax=Parachryseolinea silvisoli TaxID=2873601 RepID=UPI002265D627|nr:NAD(P)H-dependent glycerol-3-phosphate dehydrogenase [Parachryseolinea silvisoli]MCD9014020.1 NAD(P)-dependent glycerol-3-phosphate dehydrogenase [Parachryseolinea silvisoli]